MPSARLPSHRQQTIWRQLRLRQQKISAWHDRQLQPAPSSGQELDEAAIERIYQGLKEVNPGEAAKARTRMLAQLEKQRTQAEKKKLLDALARAAQRSALEELAADPRNALVKLDPEYAWQQASHEALDVPALAKLLAPCRIKGEHVYM